MPIISSVQAFNGFDNKIRRLGLEAVVQQVHDAMRAFKLVVLQERHANGTKGLRQIIDVQFEKFGGWTKLSSGGIDWKLDTERASIGVEVQVSGRSDMLAVDVLHLRQDIQNGLIDVGIIIVPDNQLSYFLTDRTPNLRTAQRHLAGNEDLPIQLVGFRHDEVGDVPLPKMRTNLGRIGE